MCQYVRLFSSVLHRSHVGTTIVHHLPVSHADKTAIPVEEMSVDLLDTVGPGRQLYGIL